MADADVGYVPSARPPSNSPEALAEYLDRELREISRVLQAGILPLIRGQAWTTLPPRPQIGDLAYLAENIAPPPGDPGWHEWSDQGGGEWVKL